MRESCLEDTRRIIPRSNLPNEPDIRLAIAPKRVLARVCVIQIAPVEVPTGRDGEGLYLSRQGARVGVADGLVCLGQDVHLQEEEDAVFGVAQAEHVPDASRGYVDEVGGQGLEHGFGCEGLWPKEPLEVGYELVVELDGAADDGCVVLEGQREPSAPVMRGMLVGPAGLDGRV